MLTRRQRLCTPRGLRRPRVGFPRSRAASTAPAPPRWPGTLTSGAEGFLSLAAPSRLASLCVVRTRPAPSLRQPFTALPLFLVPSPVDTMLLSLRGFCFVTAFSRNVKFTVLKCTIQWLLVHKTVHRSALPDSERWSPSQEAPPPPRPPLPCPPPWGGPFWTLRCGIYSSGIFSAPLPRSSLTPRRFLFSRTAFECVT